MTYSMLFSNRLEYSGILVLPTNHMCVCVYIWMMLVYNQVTILISKAEWLT